MDVHDDAMKQIRRRLPRFAAAAVLARGIKP
jgi:hypothetical protein